MIRNYIKIAWRNLWKNKFYTIINLTGLTIGLAVGLLILLWVQDELSFDRFNSKAPNIYRLETVGGLGASRRIFSTAMAPMAVFAKQELPEIVNSARITTDMIGNVFKYGDNIIGGNNPAYTDPSLFSIFDFKLIKGDRQNPFPDNNSMVITQKAALKFFGDADPIGKVLTDNKGVNFKVTGVIKDFPHNSSINYDMFFPMSYFNQLVYIKNTVIYNGALRVASMNADWSNLDFETYLLTKPGVKIDINKLQTKLRSIHIRNKAVDTDVAYLMEPLARIHLYKADGSDGGISTVRIFAVIAALVLIIACINYINLSTALSMLRAKEVSMRKIIGAAKSQLFAQFIIETGVLFLLATLLAFGLMYVLMPWYNQFSGKQLVFSLGNYHVWLAIAGTLAATLAASSIYPAMLLSGFEPLKALRGKISVGVGNTLFRKILVITQFSVSVILIISTLIIRKQLNYIRNKDLGYNKEHTFSFYMGDVSKRYAALKAELLKDRSVRDVSRSSSNIINVGAFTGDADWEGMPANTNVYFHPIAVDKTFVPFFNIKMVAGQNFTDAVADSTHFIINQAAVAQMGLTHPVGKKLRVGRTKGIITGVVQDFNITSLHQKIEPVILTFAPDKAGRIYVKTNAASAARALDAANRVWKQFDNENPIYTSFLDDDFDALYRSEQRTGALFNVFAAIAIIISCMGLFGLATYTAQVKTREIGIRKVLGANVTSIIRMLSADFLMLVVLAIVIASPIAWYGMRSWLQDFAYRISINWWTMALAGLAAIVIAFGTISFQSVRAALANPVKSLRSE